jgi:hypothetical protein
MNYMGIDHHRQYSHITLIDEKGKKLKYGRVGNLRSELDNFLSGIEEVKAVVEAGRPGYTMVDDPVDCLRFFDKIGNQLLLTKRKAALTGSPESPMPQDRIARSYSKSRLKSLYERRLKVFL